MVTPIHIAYLYNESTAEVATGAVGTNDGKRRFKYSYFQECGLPLDIVAGGTVIGRQQQSGEPRNVQETAVPQRWC